MEPCHALEILKKLGLKATGQRLEMLELLLSFRKPLSAMELREKITVKADLATVYRFLHGLASAGVIREVFSRDDRHYYEHICPEHPAHPHIYCEDCRKLFCLAPSVTVAVDFFREKEAGFTIHDVRLELYGSCPECNSSKS